VCAKLERGERPIDVARRYGTTTRAIHLARQRFEESYGHKIARLQKRGRPRKVA
jgi:hypothetical protein